MSGLDCRSKRLSFEPVGFEPTLLDGTSGLALWAGLKLLFSNLFSAPFRWLITAFFLDSENPNNPTLNEVSSYQGGLMDERRKSPSYLRRER